jgi:NAD(P)-dependent dehydrogenase (short-subunit alcohol dehydrogenase family)
MVAAQELGRYGVTANMVYLPVTDTGCVTPAVREQAVAGSPLRHVAQPHDIQRMIDKVAGPDLAHLNQLDRTVAAAGSHPVTHAGRPRSRLPASS